MRRPEVFRGWRMMLCGWDVGWGVEVENEDGELGVSQDPSWPQLTLS